MSVELLAPAGNTEKMKTAIRFGADAVYIGGKNFSLRTFADNFTSEELKNAVSYAHTLLKKVYVTVNIFAKNADFGLLKEYLKELEQIGVDAVIVSDLGVFSFVRQTAPNLQVHISTQANTLNQYAVRFWKDEGASRVILAREISLKEISEIKNFVPDIELEAFIHGAMCISYSGRCLLSDYLDGRSSNRGACVQACRWKYEIRALNPTNGETGYLGIDEDQKGTYLLNSKDLNMMAHLKELETAGIDSFKIEGRMKSEYYLATVINAYRRALDNGYSEETERELSAISHRDYTTAYMFGKNPETVNYTDSQQKGEYTYIANVLSYEDGKAVLEMRNRFQKGDVLEVLSPSDTFKKTFVADNILTSRLEETADAKLVQEKYTVACPIALKPGDFIRRKEVK